jgi:type II secretory pathway pseudopilin PulG
VVSRVLNRLRAEQGFGLIELTIAMVMLNIGILAIVAAFNSGALSLARASRVANANVIADNYMERYRGYRNCQIYLLSSTIPATAPYSTDSSYSASQVTEAQAQNGQIPATCALTGGTAVVCGTTPTATQLSVSAHNTCYMGPDKRTYIVDIFITPVSVASGGNQKKVTLVVRDPTKPSSWLVRQVSTFDSFDAP